MAGDDSCHSLKHFKISFLPNKRVFHDNAVLCVIKANFSEEKGSYFFST